MYGRTAANAFLQRVVLQQNKEYCHMISAVECTELIYNKLP